MKIEPYTPEHLEAVVRLSLRAWAPVFESLGRVLAPEVYEAFYPSGWRASQEKSVRDACAAPDMKVWVALESGTVAACMALRYHAAGKLGEIYMIAVDPDFQRRGIAMVETGGDPGHAPARGAYEKAGFRAFHAARYFKKIQDRP